MTDTAQLGLPLLQAAQAQKHVTMNEALSRLDGLVQLTIQSRTLAVPPVVIGDGLVWSVPAGAVNEWSGQDGALAVGRNGGWDFVSPKRGWRALLLDEGIQAIHDGTVWRAGMLTLSSNNAGMLAKVAEIDHTVTAGTLSTTANLIPPNAVVLGATARVLATITGTLTSWQLGNPGAVGRYGSGLGTTANAFARGVLGQPTAFYSATPMQLDATGGSFAGGSVRIAVHYFEIGLPDL
ncbi:DUF2793 domain-containing protein [Frigidibacter sp. RF13]|uniref:DUF2793 domain-containing protein n=1 Tax=Frigidibacter sp. RF13 TaxID=2997340 RepID=UPI00226D4710|nr:DUF2793 domain-containing protein [Frigidibacter sp. RF13]MCY1127213.1 DUF2793 domain-containing protein [Frigidibacter sp. RF13]